MAITLTLYGRPGCCLCDRLEELVRAELARRAVEAVVALRKRNIDQDTEAYALYAGRIPVLAGAGGVVLEGRPEVGEVRGAIGRLLGGAPVSAQGGELPLE